jgi:hypothetical protein
MLMVPGFCGVATRGALVCALRHGDGAGLIQEAYSMESLKSTGREIA